MKAYDVKLKRKIYGLLGLFFLLGLVLLGSAFDHQVLQRDRYLSWADNQQLQPINLIPLRGRILDRRGNPMAVSLKAGSLFAHPASVKDPASTADRLSPLLGVPVPRLEATLKKDLPFTWLARQIPMETAEKVRGLRLSGVGMEKEGKRYYPNRRMAGHILGFTGIDSQGLEGLEWGFDQYLSGPQGRLMLQRDAHGNVLWQEVPEKKGRSGCCELQLTLDIRIQYFAEEALGEAVRSSGALSGTSVVMDPRSGEILAMACVPEFDPNRYRTSDAARWRNRSITDTFEPGSTIKVLAVAAAMEEGVVDEETTFDCENGRFRYGGCTLHDMKPHGELSVREILKVSSNIGTAKIADKLGGQSLWTYLNNFGFGKKSGVDLPGEVPGLLRDWNNWSRIEVATHAFGQGFSVTALQLACAFSALANGGFLIEPYLVQTVRDEKGEVILDRKPRALRRVLSPRSAERALLLMEQVVEDGTGRAAGIRGFRVGGKTGTAQKFDSKAMAYSDERSVVSFVGILPVDDPDLVIVVVLDEPQGKASGGKTAAPVFRSIASRSMHYRRVPARDAGTEPPPRSFRFCSLASGTEGAGSHPGTAGPAFRGSGRWEMPELRFRPLRSALRALDGLPVAIRLEGSGTVVFQDPLPGSLVGAGQALYLRAVPGAAEGAGQG